MRGKIADTLNKKNLVNAVVSLIQFKESSFYGFTRSQKNGDFTLPRVDSGKYIILVTYPGFADFSDTYEIKN
ncbi:MAG: hypothetical protein NVS1B13_26210 [Flavisolibacter sp.]